MSIIDKNNLNVPDFINTDFFEKALKSGLQETNIQIKDVYLTKGNKPGDNYCSTIYRAKVIFIRNGQNIETIHLIIKTLVLNPVTAVFKDAGIFEQESDIYTEVLPKIEASLQGQSMVPKFFYYTDYPNDTVVFQDANVLGYKLANRAKGLNEAHCALVLRKLAKYHAASMHVAWKCPEIFEKYKTDIIRSSAKNSSPMNQSFVMNYECLTKVVSSWPGFEGILEKLKRFTQTVKGGYGEWCKPNADEIKVLVHNDLWINNILFKYDEEKPVDLYFIDFQTSFYSSPGIDLTHFLYTSPEYHLLEEKRDYMIEEFYYKTLESTLKKLKYTPIPTLNNILDEIRKQEIVGFVWSVTKLYLICMDEDKSADNSFEALIKPEKGTQIREVGMSSERFVPTMKYILRRMESVGVLK